MSTQTITNTVTQNHIQEPKTYKWEFRWPTITLYVIMHITAVYGLYLAIVSAQWKTIFYSWFLLVIALQGVTAGTHRFWAHRTFKAKIPLRILLIILQTLSLQNDAYDWATWHRVHHKYVDTDADPHNSRRGLFFSHVGWLFVKPTPEAMEKYKSIDFSDLHADKILMFQRKYFYPFFAPVIGLLIPTLIPCYLWNETLSHSFFISAMLRYALCCNITFLVNSFAHIYGTKPYDKYVLVKKFRNKVETFRNINPTELPIVSVLSGGEGWHNYHHTFPWDYKTGEFGKYRSNSTTAFLDFMAAIGWAYDLKTTSQEMIMKRVNRTGDGSRKFDKILNQLIEDDHNEEVIWGWGDKDITEEHLSIIEVRNRQKSD